MVYAHGIPKIDDNQKNEIKNQFELSRHRVFFTNENNNNQQCSESQREYFWRIERILQQQNLVKKIKKIGIKKTKMFCVIWSKI